MLEPASYEELEEEEEKEFDDLDLEFLLYSQLHYEQSDDLEAGQETGRAEGRSTESVSKNGKDNSKKLEHFMDPDTSVQKVLKKKTGKNTVKLKGLKRRADSPSGKSETLAKKPRIAKQIASSKTKLSSFVSDEVITIDCDTDSLLKIPSKSYFPKGRSLQRQKVMVELDSLLEPDCGVISISSDSSTICLDTSDMSSESSDEFISGSCSDSLDSDASDLNTPNLKVHVDSDQEVLLNRKVSEEAHGKKWKINEMDRLAGIVQGERSSKRRFGGAGLVGRYYKPSSVKCSNCNEIGHLPRDCPKPKKSDICFLCGITGHNFRDCPQSLCYNCDQPGHISKACRASKRFLYKECRRCLMYGHLQETSGFPKLKQPRSCNINSRKSCYNCASKNHFGFECTKDRIDRHSMATYPFIARYEKRKQLRTYYKVNEDRESKREQAKGRKRQTVFECGRVTANENVPKTKKLTSGHHKKSHQNPNCVNTDVDPNGPNLELFCNNFEFLKRDLATIQNFSATDNLPAKMLNVKVSKKGKRKSRQKWDSKFTAFDDTGKPFSGKKKKRNKKQCQWKVKADYPTAQDNGFSLSRAVKRAQKRMWRN